MNLKFWKGKRVLLTGHTGFKGSWLALWLQSMGVELIGYALAPPTQPNLFEVARVGTEMTSIVADVRDLVTLQSVFGEYKPEIVFHLAAQPLVRQSYQNPVETFSTNIMGTVHVLEAVRNCSSVKAVVNVTSDKCYANKEWIWGYREDEALGGCDPYSNSKGCSEMVSNSYRDSFFRAMGMALATARAGNVIGGGDWAVDRLVPDILRAFEREEQVIIRNPHAIRPWQHVLEPLAGYLTLAEFLYKGGQQYAEAWNFGPLDDDARPVHWIAEKLAASWGHEPKWLLDRNNHSHEASVLKLDISKAKSRLAWQPRWTLLKALDCIVVWHQKWLAKEDMKAVTLDQIFQYQS